jgi:hypothetical protein
MIQHRVLFADDTSLLCSSDSKQISKNTFKSGLSENSQKYFSVSLYYIILNSPGKPQVKCAQT